MPREFFRRYDGARLPREDIAKNVLFDMGVPRDVTGRAFQLLQQLAKECGFIREIGGQTYVDLSRADGPAGAVETGRQAPGTEPTQHIEGAVEPIASTQYDAPAEAGRWASNRVFLTHGKNRNLIPQLKELLQFGQFEPVVSIERESLAKPIPEKVMDDMRRCSAAIIHVDAERELMTQDGQREIVLNPNVMIEIGAAMALYGSRFILLVQEGVRLPSNLSGLYEVRYGGEKLDGDATLRLLKAFNEFKSSASLRPSS